MRKRVLLWVGAGVVAGALLLQPGCETLTPEQTSGYVEGGQEALATVDQNLAEARARLAALEASQDTDPEALATVRAYIAGLEKGRSHAEEALKALEGAITAEGELDPGAAAKGLGALLPPPWGVIVPSVIGLGVGLARANRVRAAARKLIESIEALKASNPVAKAILEDQASVDVLDAVQTPAAKRLVDEVQGKVHGLPV